MHSVFLFIQDPTFCDYYHKFITCLNIAQKCQTALAFGTAWRGTSEYS